MRPAHRRALLRRQLRALHRSCLAGGGGGRIDRLVEDGDRIEIDIPNRTINLALSDAEIAERRAAMEARGDDAWRPGARETQGVERAAGIRRAHHQRRPWRGAGCEPGSAEGLARRAALPAFELRPCRPLGRQSGRSAPTGRPLLGHPAGRPLLSTNVALLRAAHHASGGASAARNRATPSSSAPPLSTVHTSSPAGA